MRPAHCAPLGDALAALHLAGAGYAAERPNALGPAGWRPLLDRSLPRAPTRCSPVWRRSSTAALDRILAAWPAGLPRGHIHADLFPDNVFFLDGRLSGLIDFYFAATDLFAYDLAVCLNAWCFEPDLQFNVTKARALLRGLRRPPPAQPGRAGGAARAVPGRRDPFPADPAVRLGEHPARCAGYPQGPAGIPQAGSASTLRPRMTNMPTDSDPPDTGGDLDRWRLQAQPGPGRLGRHPALPRLPSAS